MGNKKLLNNAGTHYFMGMIEFSNLKCTLPEEKQNDYSFAVNKDNVLQHVLVRTRSETDKSTKNDWFPFDVPAKFDWLALICKFKNGELSSWIIPIDIAIKYATPAENDVTTPQIKHLSLARLEIAELAAFKNNWSLNRPTINPIDD